MSTTIRSIIGSILVTVQAVGMASGHATLPTLIAGLIGTSLMVSVVRDNRKRAAARTAAQRSRTPARKGK